MIRPSRLLKRLFRKRGWRGSAPSPPPRTHVLADEIEKNFSAVSGRAAFAERDYAQAIRLSLNDGGPMLDLLEIEELAGLLDANDVRGWGEYPASRFLYAVVTLDHLLDTGDVASFKNKFHSHSPNCCPFTGAVCSMAVGTLSTNRLEAAIAACDFLLINGPPMCERRPVVKSLHASLAARYSTRSEVNRAGAPSHKKTPLPKSLLDIPLTGSVLQSPEITQLSKLVIQFHQSGDLGPQSLVLDELPEITLQRCTDGSLHSLIRSVADQLGADQDVRVRLAAAQFLRAFD